MLRTEAVIRKPQADELNSVRSLVRTVVDEVYGYLWAPAPLLIDEEDWSLAWIAAVDTHLVGMVLTSDEWIGDLWVLREYRRHGVGKKLLAQGAS